MAFFAQAQSPSGTLGDVWVNVGTGMFCVYGASGWNPIFNINSPNGGMMPIGGADMAGPITGNHGLLPKNNPSMTGNGLLNDKDIVDIDRMQTYVKEQIDLKLAANQASAGGSTGSGSGGTGTTADVKVAVASGTKGPTTGPLSGAVSSTDYLVTIGPGSQGDWPYFTIGGDAIPADPLTHQIAVLVAPQKWQWADFSDNEWIAEIKRTGSTSSYTYQAYARRQGGSNETRGMYLSYIAVAIAT